MFNENLQLILIPYVRPAYVYVDGRILFWEGDYGY